MINKNVQAYVKQIALKHNITQDQAKEIIMYALENVIKALEQGHEVHLKGFGKIRFKKETYAKYLRAIRNADKLKEGGK